LTGTRSVLPGEIVCLPSGDPLLCPAEEKADRETTNTLRQLQYLEQLVAMGVQDVRESHVLELQRIAVDGIFPCAGSYRNVTRSAELQGGAVTHVPPEPALVPNLVREAIDRINGMLAESRAADDERARSRRVVEAAAYALWRLNWIHPFSGGNGRSSRAIAYLILCIDYGGMLPGKPSMPTLISQRRHEYERALREADAADARNEEDFRAMRRLVNTTVVEQLDAAVRQAETTIRKIETRGQRTERKKSRKAQRKARQKSRR
jgi:Fic family protein